ncbi:MAG: type II toxin-antitoxin system HicB family antitoxin [Myxococcota bacterium]|nr:type II toxin-antitoxin system HicB family antitoxin [Myxococcota bacterium]
MGTRTGRLRYQILLRPEPEGGFTVFVPSLPGCMTWGRDVEHAKAMAGDAIRAYVASLRKHGEPVPSDADSLIASIEVRAVHG